MARKVLGAAVTVACAMMAAAPAQAVVIDLTAPTTKTGGTDNGNAFTYVIGSGANQLQLRATAWSIDTTKNPDAVQTAILRSYSGGLGVQDRNETNVSPDHAIDNSDGWVDFVMLQFDKAVDLNGINIGWYSNDADATIRWGNLATNWTISPSIIGSVTTLNGLMAGQVNSNVSSNYTGDRLLDIPISNTLIISSRSGSGADRYADYFKLKSVDVSAAVPEPSTWLSMIVGFGMIGTMMRRRRSGDTLNGAIPA